MSRSCGLGLILFFGCTALIADDQALWKEYGLIHTQTAKQNKLDYTAYRFKDLTGALAAWEWQRSARGKPCDLAPYCTADENRTIIFADNYLLIFDSASPQKADVDDVLRSLSNRTDTSLPAILTYIPRSGLVPNSARYVLGKESLKAFAPELSSANTGFEQGTEAQTAEYRLGNDPKSVRLALFYYPTPEMARLHSIDFKLIPNVQVKRSGVLIAVVYGDATTKQADTLLSRVEYEAKITWNDVPGPSPIKPLYRLLLNIIYLSTALCCIGLLAGVMYAGMRLYRRRYGQLESEEALTTLHLTGD